MGAASSQSTTPRRGSGPESRHFREAFGETSRQYASFIKPVTPFRVFASFDVERDQDLLQRLVAEGRSKNSPFIVFDRSCKEAPGQEAEERLRDRISRIDAVVVLCGEWTHRAPNVSEELRLAQELGKRYYLIKGRRIDCARPATARIDDKMYLWKNGVISELVFRFR
ncbi:MAG TPA: TIR domain-containing protein [Fimbriimonadaceae bacterium]|nr:TIR domain-containing protein [Fimbriimonadaceae bacterium]